VDPRAGLNDVEKRNFLTLPGLELRPLCRPAVASLYTDYAIPALKIAENGLQTDLSLLTPAHAGSSFADFSTLKMEAIHSSETSVHTRSTRRYIPEDDILHSDAMKTSNLTFSYVVHVFLSQKKISFRELF
jgi:hypothetical protein